MANPEVLIAEAIKLENTKGFYEYVSKEMTFEKYGNIAELYEKAGNIYKITDREKALECFVKALNFYEKSKPMGEMYSGMQSKCYMLDIAELCEKNDYVKSIEFYERIINYYMEKGDIKSLLKYYEIVGKLYFANNVYEKAEEIFRKMLQIIGQNDKLSSYKKSACEKLCEMLIGFDISNKYLEASLLYLELANAYLSSTLGSYSASKYIYLSILSLCAGEDFVKAKQVYEEYSEKHFGFAKSSEGIFITNLLEAIDMNNDDEIGSICYERDKIRSLEGTEVKLLLKIKKNITGQYDDLNNMNELDNMNNLDNTNKSSEEEIDLC